jgi:hypothetical protein
MGVTADIPSPYMLTDNELQVKRIFSCPSPVRRLVTRDFGLTFCRGGYRLKSKNVLSFRNEGGYLKSVSYWSKRRVL